MDPLPKRAVSQVRLPSGRLLEVVLPVVAPHDGEACERCPECSSPLVEPTAWSRAGALWQVSMRCPECEWVDSVLVDQPAAEALDERTEAAADLLLRDLKRLAQANMANDVERFATALKADAIVPFDF